MVEFYLPLYYKPGPDMDTEGKENFNPEVLIKHGKYLKEGLEQIAKMAGIITGLFTILFVQKRFL